MRYLKAPGSSTIATDITVRVRDSGSNGNTVPLTEGASLVLVYRHPSLSFKSIVLFDGAETMDNSNDSMNLAINGFYQAKRGAAKFTPIVGNGQTSFSERLFFNNSLLETNAFRNGWDDKTHDVSSLVVPAVVPPGQIISTANTRIDHLGTPYDCLSWQPSFLAPRFRTVTKMACSMSGKRTDIRTSAATCWWTCAVSRIR
jgi:hypothetical protein